MSEIDLFIGQQRDALIWEALQTFRESPDWMMAARVLIAYVHRFAR